MPPPYPPPVDMPSFRTPSNQNLFSTCVVDESFDLGGVISNQINSQPLGNVFDYMSIPSSRMSYDLADHGTHAHVSKQDPAIVLSLGPNNQLELGKRMAQYMRRNIFSVSPPRTQVSSFVDYSPVQDNPHVTRVSITETVTKQYSAVIPTSVAFPVQNDIERVRRALACEPNIWHSPSTRLSLPRKSFGAQSMDDGRTRHPEILTAEPLNTVFPSPWPQRERKLDDPIHPESLNASIPPDYRDKRRSCQEFSQPQPSRGRTPRQPKKIEDIVGYFLNCSDEEDECDDDDAYDGRTHSLPYEKYGPYTCPKCNALFDTSQKFAAHMVSIHYKNETGKEKRKRLRARYKKQLRQLNLETPAVIHDVSEPSRAEQELGMTDLEVEKEERVAVCSEGASIGDGFLHDVVVKQEELM